MLLTKLMPPSSARRLVRRPRLQARSLELARTKLALVRAPAGFGKTTLLRQWYDALRAGGMAAGWLSFDPSDTGGIGVLAYLVQAIESAGHRFGPPVASIVAPESVATVDAAIDTVVNDLCGAGRPVFLFLDDVHALRTAAASEALALFLERAPDSLHVAVASREEPHMPLARARALGNVVEITALDLRFSRDETVEFMSAFNHERLDVGDIEKLDARVEGWAAGLTLAALALEGALDPGDVLDSISGRGRSFAGYFVEVVLARQSAELREFLLSTSLLERFSPELCDAVTEGSEARAFIDEIESRGLFVFSLDGERRWYRYHHLFADFLRRELARRDPDRAVAIHGRASRWLAAAGLHDAAFEHAIAANDFELAASALAERCHTMFYDGQLRVLLDRASQLPESILDDHPRVQLAKAWSLVLEWKFVETRAILAKVRASLARSGRATPLDRTLLLHCTMMLAQFEDDMPAVERHCTTLLDECLDADPYVIGTYYTSLLYAEREQFKLLRYERLGARAHEYFRIAGSRFVLVWHESIVGPTRFLAGDSQGAIESREDGMRAAVAVGGAESSLASIPALLLAEIHYERNELEIASTLLDRHLARASELGFVDQLIAGYVTSSRLARLRGDAREAERMLGRGMDLAHARGFGRLEQHIVAEQMARSLAEGAVDRARRLATVPDLRVERRFVIPRPGATTRDEARASAWVGFARAEGRLDDALEVARRWQRFVERAGAVRSDVRWSLVVAQIVLARGDARAAER
ncbi:MAG: hypothetical protein IAI48_11040, partial [Candidatus Eremiobacteraeota bacterium]|nr:hypothetical protein [Candidatus Eremiobacteraeota bacterium]